MKLRAAIAAVVVAAAQPAWAESRKLLVMQSEGRADAATRARIDAAIVKLARAGEPQTAAGELTFSDAATAVGCKPESAGCKDEVLGMLSVDELVITRVAPKPGGLEITVQRVARGGASREASMLLPSGTPADKLDGIAPLFTDEPAPPATAPEPVVAPPRTLQQPPSPSVITTDQRADQRTTQHRLQLAGMASGGGLLVLGFFLWGAARGVQTDIDSAPTMTADDLARLRELEDKGDNYATLGNLCVVSGIVLAGLGTYFYIKDRPRRASAVARITPVVFDRGGGLVLTLGTMP